MWPMRYHYIELLRLLRYSELQVRFWARGCLATLTDKKNEETAALDLQVTSINLSLVYSQLYSRNRILTRFQSSATVFAVSIGALDLQNPRSMRLRPRNYEAMIWSGPRLSGFVSWSMWGWGSADKEKHKNRKERLGWRSFRDPAGRNSLLG